jgi:hypothetical protein
MAGKNIFLMELYTKLDESEIESVFGTGILLKGINLR